jgi:acetyl esterase
VNPPHLSTDMNHIRNVFTTSQHAPAAGAVRVAGSAGVEHNTQGFLEALAKGGSPPLETLSLADARAVLVGAGPGQRPRACGADRENQSPWQ